MLHKIFVLGRDFSARMKKQNISAYAASIAFFFFLSIVPMLIVICTIIPYTPLTERNLVEALTDLVPDMAAPLVVSLISDVYEKSAGILSVAVIATLWSASKGVTALMRGLNAVNGVEEKRNYFVVRGVASLYTLVMLVVLILSLFLNVFGNQLVKLILYRVPVLRELVFFLLHFRFLLVWVVLTVLFSAIYAYVPDEKLKFTEQVPGAMFTAVVWNVFSWGFSLYVNHSNSYGIYGSLSIIVIVLIWMYFCMYIMMIGAHLNRYFRPVDGETALGAAGEGAADKGTTGGA